MAKSTGATPKPDAARSEPAEKYVGLRIPSHLNDRLDAIARRENNGKSAVLRRLISRALATSPDDEAA